MTETGKQKDSDKVLAKATEDMLEAIDRAIDTDARLEELHRQAEERRKEEKR